jgi:uncharacterized membrane protein YhaH (DUF805 family)
MNLYEGERGLLSYFLFGLLPRVAAVVKRLKDTMRRG